MSAHFTTPTDELLLLAETLGEVKTKADKLEAEFATQARPLEAATNALSAALSGIKALQFHVLDNNLGALSARVEEMRKAVDEQVGVIALELKKADETNAAKAGQEAEALRSEIAALQAQLGTLGAQFSAQLERVEFSAKEEAKKLQLIPGPAGAAGASLNPRGTFIDGETYNRLDVVSWLGSSYIAAVDGVTEKPSKNSNQWQVLASRGSGGSGGAGDFGSLAGVAQINQGGTGQTTRAAGLNALLPDQAGATQYMLLTDGAGTVSWGAQPVAGLPSQTGNSGKLLTTNGTSASWSAVLSANADTSLQVGALAPYQRATIGLTRRLNYGDALFARNLQGKASSDNYTTVGTDSGSGYAGFEAQYGGVARILLGTGATTAGADVTPTVALSASTSAVSIPLTTASTSTSTGALVVGNGTSGGLGVGGSVNINNNLTLGYASAGDSVLKIIRSSGGSEWLQIAGWSAGSLGNNAYSIDAVNGASARPVYFRRSTDAGSTYTNFLTWDTSNNATFDGRITSSTNTDSGVLQLNLVNSSTGTSASSLFRFNAGTRTATLQAYNDTHATLAGQLRIATSNGDIVLIPSGVAATTFGSSTVTVNHSTASTSTSSGALVVSGGVGVAGNINSGGTLRFNTNANLPGVGSMGISATYGLNMYASTGSSYDFTVFNAAGTSLILNPTGTQNVTFPGVVAIGNTVTTGVAVASTHKVQISIGGTTYYLLASNV